MSPRTEHRMQPLFQRAMGRLFHLLPDAVQRQHGVRDVILSEGRCTIERGRAPDARLIAWLFGFPPAGRDLPTLVTVIAEAGREIWHRDFGGNGIFTVLEPAAAPMQARARGPVIVERFGIVTFDLVVTEIENGIRLAVAGMRACGVPVPRAFWPRLVAEERAEAQRFMFDIAIDLGWNLGWGQKLIHYRGWVAPA